MTKAKLIEAMQTKEAELYSDFKVCKEHFGEDDSLTRRSAAQWIVIYNLMESLGISDKQNTIIRD
jgi:hypothetical protein